MFTLDALDALFALDALVAFSPGGAFRAVLAGDTLGAYGTIRTVHTRWPSRTCRPRDTLRTVITRRTCGPNVTLRTRHSIGTISSIRSWGSVGPGWSRLALRSRCAVSPGWACRSLGSRHRLTAPGTRLALRSSGSSGSDCAVSPGGSGVALGSSGSGRTGWADAARAATASVLRDQVFDFVGDYRGELRALRVGGINRNQFVRHSVALL